MSNEPRYLYRLAHILLVVLAFLLAGTNSASADLDDGLVGYWSFDEGEGGTAYDYSGNGNDGTIYGATWTAGIFGAALHFNGIDDYVDCGHGESIDSLSRPYQDSTWSMWFKTSEDGRMIGKYYPFQFIVMDHKLHAFIYNGQEFVLGYEPQAGSDVTDDQWHHAVFVLDRDGDFNIYLDGSPDGAEDISTHAFEHWPETNTLYHGCRNPGHGHFNGIIDEVRIYDRALSDDEILDLYWSTTHPDPQDDTTEGEQSETSGTSSDPVNTATGSFFHQETDLSIPSRGSPLIFTRFYNSKAAASAAKSAKSGQTGVKSKQASQRKTPTSQPVSTKDGERASTEAKKQNESPAGKHPKQTPASSQARPKTKEESK